MLRKIIAALVMLFAFVNPSYADITIQEVESAPFGWYHTYTPIKGESEIPDKTAVTDEIYHLNRFLEQKTFKWTVNIVKQRAVIKENGTLKSGTGIYGAAGRDGNAYIFSYPVLATGNDRGYFSKLFDANVVAHEVGHMVRFEFISESALQEYVELRKDGKEYSDYVDLPEELFAEDFRWLFSSKKSRKEYYKPYHLKPGEKERKWILEKLGIEYTPPKPEEIKPSIALNTVIAPSVQIKKLQPKPPILAKKPIKPIKKLPKPIKKVTKIVYKSR